jgi:ATP-dependent RNA helicase DDX46/PRP5
MKFRKNFYSETSEIAKMTDEDVKEYRKSMDNMKIRGLKCPRPIKNWYQCGLSNRILEIISEQGYEKPTSIQAQAIPAIMSGRDLIGIAKTGSGKTMAFVLPMLRHVLDQPKILINDGPIALIMTPTRELAMQTYSECCKFTKFLGLSVVCAYGGAPIKDQIADLKRGAEIVICTPGRMIDLLLANSGKVTNLRRVTYLVLDEADRMFDMGFGPQVIKIIGNIRPDKQAVLFSATFPKQMDILARKVLHKPIEIVVGGISTVCDDVEQIVEVLNEEEKFLRLLQVLGEWYEVETEQILIFVDRQDAADHLLRDLLKRGYPCLSLHGGKDQADRDSTISDFKLGNIPILIATSVAARGLDVKDLGLVINYECPNHMEDYVHRVGRTGRAGNKGTAITFITKEQERFAPDIVKALKTSNVSIPKELEILSESFMSKVRSGEAQSAGSGFGGKGLERIDEERAALRKSQKRAFGAEEEDEEEEVTNNLEELSDKTIKSAKEAQEKPPASTTQVTSTIKPQKHKQAESMPNAIKTAQLAAAQIASKVAALNPKTQNNTDALTAINARFKPPSNSPAAQGEIQPMFEPKQLGEDSVNVPSVIRGYCCEIEINDYPQNARWKITNRDTVSSIIDYSETSIVVRGLFFPPGKVPRDTERRLHLRIEGSTEVSVEKARAEVQRILVEATMEAAERGTIDYSRYNL